jgi:hypothetical protein
LVLRVIGIFLIEDLVVLGVCTAGSTSCAEGSSGVAARVDEASAASFCGSSSSLQKETCYIQPDRKKEQQNRRTRRNIYDAMRSKNLTSSSSIGASSAAVLYAEVLEEANSSMRFLFLSIPVSSESAGGGDVIELVSSSDSSASSPS